MIFRPGGVLAGERRCELFEAHRAVVEEIAIITGSRPAAWQSARINAVSVLRDDSHSTSPPVSRSSAVGVRC